MASLREIRRKIKSVKSTEQITKAMKMVAAARMRRAQTSILSARPFALKMSELVGSLRLIEETRRKEAGEKNSAPIHEFFETRPEGGAEMLVLVAADKGLCGAFNSIMLRAAVAWIRLRPGRKIYVAAVGRKSRDFLHRLRGFDLEISNELVGIFPRVSFVHAEILGQAVIDAFTKTKVSSVTVLYNEFKSVAQQKLVEIRLLPLAESGAAAVPGALSDYEFEPTRGELLASLLPRHLKAQIYRILLESQAAELASRMNAMDAASKNARELRDQLNLNLNRQRQAIITKEIAELVGGAEALAA
jgi:F-type H+-transporting ATPase subunit gamma